MAMTARQRSGGSAVQMSHQGPFIGTGKGIVGAVHTALIRRPKFGRVPVRHLELLGARGDDHDHVRIRGTGLLLRVPKRCQMGTDPFANLAYQAACFDRAGASGHVPRIHGALSPAKDLPLGALIVQDIHGRAAALPQDLPAIAAALASIHGLPVPPTNRRRPLLDQVSPLSAAQPATATWAAAVARAGLPTQAADAVAAELEAAQSDLRTAPPPEVTLIGFDTQPGNFVIEPHGAAVLVDLDKARYGAPGIDLARATLPCCARWDAPADLDVGADDVATAYAHWLAAVPPRLADRSRPTLMALRRLVWLWSVACCARWRATGAGRRVPADAETDADWPLETIGDASDASLAERVDRVLSADAIDRVRGDWRSDQALSRLLGRLD